jgi:putative colanic acid biosynthesis UDP-glucose lipid carrier transferase
MNRRFLRSLQVSLVVLDFISLNTIFFTAEFLFRKHVLITPDLEYVYFGLSLNAMWILAVLFLNIYGERYILSFEQFTKISMRAFVYFVLLVSIELFFFRLMLLSRVFILVVLSSIAISFLLNRFVYLIIYHYFKKKDWLVNRVIVLGYNNLSKKLVDYLEEDAINKKEVIGYCEEYENVKELSRYPILSDISGTMAVCKEHNVTEIYSTIAPEQNPGLYKLIQHADENLIRFKIVPDLGFFVKKQMHVDFLKEIPVLSLRREPLEDLDNRIRKRIFDIVVSSLVIVFILSWLIPILSLLIKLDSPGPVFFVQPRTGKDNKKFLCLKFRSMRVNPEADIQQASRHDSRITRLGRFLRRTSLDEFPQFLNVLKGDMSIIGPRPHMLKHTDQYSRLVGQYMVRQFLKPGISGWAQVNGCRGETRSVAQMQRRIEHDLWYLENWSLMFDLRIMFLTVFNTAKGDENAF